jgi:hypothetical protein
VAVLAVSVPALAAPKSPEALANPPAPASAAEPKSRFTGMDEAVNEKMSEEAGLKAKEPYINLESQGDLWNAALLLGGGIAGFLLGRNWHILFGGQKPSAEAMNQQFETTS